MNTCYLISQKLWKISKSITMDHAMRLDENDSTRKTMLQRPIGKRRSRFNMKLLIAHRCNALPYKSSSLERNILLVEWFFPMPFSPFYLVRSYQLGLPYVSFSTNIPLLNVLTLKFWYILWYVTIPLPAKEQHFFK